MPHFHLDFCGFLTVVATELRSLYDSGLRLFCLPFESGRAKSCTRHLETRLLGRSNNLLECSDSLTFPTAVPIGKDCLKSR